MFSNDWTITTKLTGNFDLVLSQNHDSAEIFPGLKHLHLQHDVGANNQRTDTHTLTLVLTISPPEDVDSLGRVVLDRSKEIVSHLAARLALASGHRVEMTGGVTAQQFDELEPKRGRAVVSTEGVDLAPPTPLPIAMLQQSAQPSLERAIYWWSHAIRIADPAERLHALFVSLDLVAAALTPPSSRERKCKECGFTEKLQPGLREKIVHLLNTRGELAKSLCEQIYETRNELTHGKAALNEENRRRYRQHADHVQKVVRDEIASRMNCKLPPMPALMGIDFRSTCLLIEFTKP